MARAKIFFANGSIRIRPPKPAPTPISSVGPMSIGNMFQAFWFIRTMNLDKWNILARWSDNVQHPTGEVQLINLQTLSGTYKVYYTSSPNPAGTARRVTSTRVEVNGSSTSYTDNAIITAGPLNITLSPQAVGLGRILSVSWSRIDNIVSLGGLLAVMLKRIAANNGVLWEGAIGAGADGIGDAASIYGRSRNSFVTGIGVQSVEPDLVVYSDEIKFIDEVVIPTLAPLETDILNVVVNGSPLSVWDPESYEAISPIAQLPVLLENFQTNNNNASIYSQAFNQDNINYTP